MSDTVIIDALLKKQAAALTWPNSPIRSAFLQLLRLTINRLLFKMDRAERELLADGGPEFIP